MRYFIHAPDDGSGHAVIKNENGWIFCRAPLKKAREICNELNKKEG